ncbi:MAG: hypothetical protein K8F56_12180 [Rhodocyclaceae bacterium]|jgi:hypothetical protein|nr:hypothetical protein [Rhodocyclaceae bacterium]
MKKTDLEKLKGLKIDSRMKHAGTPGRFGAAATEAVSRREQRERERAQGLVPFAVKLDSELVKRVQALAMERKAGLNEVVAELLEKGMAR